jgi:hypothetical protein
MAKANVANDKAEKMLASLIAIELGFLSSRVLKKISRPKTSGCRSRFITRRIASIYHLRLDSFMRIARHCKLFDHAHVRNATSPRRDALFQAMSMEWLLCATTLCVAGVRRMVAAVPQSVSQIRRANNCRRRVDRMLQGHG